MDDLLNAVERLTVEVEMLRAVVRAANPLHDVLSEWEGGADLADLDVSVMLRDYRHARQRVPMPEEING